MPGYHYKRKGFFYGGNTGIGGHHAGAVAGEGTGAQGPAGGQSTGGDYGGGQNNGQGNGQDRGDNKDDKGWFSNLGETVSNVVTPENVMKAILSAAIPGFGIMSTVAPALSGFFGFDPSTPTTSPETDPNKGGQDQRLLANVDIPTVDQTQTISPEISGLTAEQNLELARLIKKGYPADYAEAVVRAI